MDVIHQKIVLDINNNDSLETLEMKQGDKGSRYIDVTITADGHKLEISDIASTARFAASNNGKLLQNEAFELKADNTVTVEVSENALSVSGMLECEVILYNDEGERVTSATFYIRVGASVKGEMGDIINATDGIVKENMLDTGAVTESKLDEGAVTESKIAQDAVTESKLAKKAVTTEKIASGAVVPDKLDRTYLEARSTGALPGDAFHNFLLSGIRENGDHLKTIHLFVSRGDGILENVGAGRCKGFYVNSTRFTFENLNTNKVYQVVFTDEGITSITEKYADIADASILRKHLSDSLLIPDKMLEESYWKIKGYSSATSYADLDAVFDDEDLYDTIYQFKFSGLSPMAAVLGSDYYIAIASSETDILILINRTNGDRWSYEKGSDTLTAIGSSDTAEEASFGTTTWNSFSPVSTTESAYVFNHVGASISGELKSISVKCDVAATVKFAIAHMENNAVSSVDDIYITTKVGENTYVNGEDFYYDGTIQKGDLIGYCRDISCKIYYGTSEDEWCYKTASLTDYTLTAKTYGFAISAVVETKGYENRIVTLENDVAALKQNKASSILEVIGTEIDPSIANYADSEKFVIRLTPSTADATLTMEKSEDVNTSAVRQICYVDFTNGKMGFFKRCADGAAPAIYQKKAISFSIVSGHEYVVEMIKEDSKYAILRITDALSLETDEISCSEFEVGRGWGSRKYDYTGDAGDITSVKSYIMQQKKTKLLIVGDSYIEGSSLPEFGEDRNNRYAMLLKNAVDGDCFINGRGGAASADMLGWFNTYLPDVCQPEYTIISCGANDSNYENWLARYQSIIAKIKEMGSKPILTTVAAISVSASKDIFGQMNEWIRSSGYDYIDVNLVTSLDYGMTELNPDYFFSDNAHPNSVGHDIIFKRAQIDVPYLFQNSEGDSYVESDFINVGTFSTLDELKNYSFERNKTYRFYIPSFVGTVPVGQYIGSCIKIDAGEPKTLEFSNIIPDGKGYSLNLETGELAESDMTEEIKNTLGDIDTALDSIIAIQNSYIGGAAE